MAIIEVKTKKKKKKVAPHFVVEIEWMHGDADGYTDGTFGPFPVDGKALIDFTEMLDSIQRGGFKLANGVRIGDCCPTENLYWVGNLVGNELFYKGDYLSEEKAEELGIFDIPENKAEIVTDELIEAIDFNMERDMRYDGFAKMDGYDIYYIDEDGIKNACTIKPQDSDYDKEDTLVYDLNNVTIKFK